MKKFISTIVVLFAMALTIQAQTADQPLGFKMLFGSQAYIGDLGNQATHYSTSDHTYGLGLSYYISKHFDTSLELKWMRLELSNPLNHRDFKKRRTSFSSENLNLNVLFRYKPVKTRLNPYIAAGAGFNFIEDVSQARKDPSYTALSIPFGVGVNYELKEHIMVSVQALYNRTFSDAIDNYPLDADGAAPGVSPRQDFDDKDHDDYFTLTAGLVFTFGGKEKKKTDTNAIYRQSLDNMKTAEQAYKEAAHNLNQARQLNEETSTALNELQDALDQVPQQSEELKAELVHIVNNIQFVYDKAEIIEPAYEELNSLASILELYPGLSVEIAGRADQKGSKDYNDKLSMQRAQTVKDYLVNKGIRKSRIKVVSLGKTNPLMDGSSQTAYAQNRSVQLSLHYTGNQSK